MCQGVVVVVEGLVCGGSDDDDGFSCGGAGGGDGAAGGGSGGGDSLPATVPWW